MLAVEIKNLRKTYGQITALDNISFNVKTGEIFGLIGPDGAGKSTLIRILATLLVPDSGQAKIFGFDTVKNYKQIRKIIGYMPQRFSLYEDLSVEENLRFFARIYGSSPEKNYHVIKHIYSQLVPFKRRQAGKLSGGMKQKLALSCALIHNPRLLLLDEPTTGVDALSRKEFWNTLAQLRDKGLTIIVTTPYMDEASKCNTIALINKGRVLKTGSPQQLIQAFPKKIFAVHISDKYKGLSLLRSYRFCYSAYSFGQTIHYIDQRKEADVAELETYLDNNGLKAQVVPISPSIEDLFIYEISLNS